MTRIWKARRLPNLPSITLVVVCSAGVRKQGIPEGIYRRRESVAKTGRLAEKLAAVLRNFLLSKKQLAAALQVGYFASCLVTGGTPLLGERDVVRAGGERKARASRLRQPP